MEEAAKSSERRRRPSFFQILGLTAVAGLVAGNTIAIVSAVSDSSTPPTAEVATGVAACEDNLPIEGVWVSAGPSSGGANMIPGSSPNQATFSKVIHVGSYTVHVGCGGSPEHWQMADYATSSAVANFPVGFDCGPPSGGSEAANRGICEQVGLTTLKAAT